MSLLAELKRRNVFRAGVAYLAFAWLVVQVASIIFPTFGFSSIALQALIIAFALGFPIVLVCAWIYELTPEGIKRAEDVTDDAQTRQFGRRLDFAIIAVLALALITVVVDQYVLEDGRRYDSIAVLPFRNLSGSPDQDYFADGMTEALIASLAKIEAVKVISRTSVMQFKDTELALPQIAERLGATAIVEASAQHVGDRVRIIAQLVDARTDQHLWAETFDRDFADVLSLQSEIVQEIARQIQVTITPEERERLRASARVDPAAYDAYLRGLQHLARLTPADIDLAEGYFEQALMRDAQSVHALTGLAASWVARAYEQIVPTRVAAPLARGYAARAELLDANVAEVHQVLSVVAWLEGDLTESETRARRALELEPNNVPALSALANIFIIAGQFAPAIERMRLATALDPFNPALRTVLAASLMGAGECDEAIDVLQESRNVFPNLETNFPILMACLHATGRLDELIAAEREWLALRGDTEAIMALDAGLAAGDYTQASRRVAQVFENRSLLTGAGGVEVAVRYSRAGDREKTVEWLERAFEQRDPNLRNVLALHMFDSVRDDARVRALLEQLGLE